MNTTAAPNTPVSIGPSKGLGAPWQAALLLVAAGACLALDRAHPLAGLALLVLLTASIGMAHGALDTWLLLRALPAQRTVQRAAWSLAYLAAAVATAALLHSQPGPALVLLLLLSWWHFGEGFELARGLAPSQRWLLRVVRGGAPVMWPALVARAELDTVVQAAAGSAAVWAWPLWTGMALVWAAATLAWVALQALPSFGGSAAQACRRRMLLEVAGLGAAYLLLSPLMAFALFFGALHSAEHIARVARRCGPATQGRALVQWSVTFGVTLVLLALLWAWMRAAAGALPQADLALRAVILSLAAVSVPHVVLIGWWARREGPARETSGRTR